jgi:phosphoenolpyruvate-protein kinase (PTS system EI component)
MLLNISDPLEALAVRKLGADGVGLFRTEFLYMDRSGWPTMEESLAAYRAVAKALGDAELHVRLADFGAEKSPPYADIPINRNPSLGLRGIRLLLQRDDILRPQVEALTRLADERPLTVLLPMVDTIDTLEKTVDRICKMTGRGCIGDLPFRVGAMIELPSAALMIDEILKRVDSASIGLNDLTQYTLAADRDDELVESYHDPLQPVILQLMRQIIVAGDRQEKPVTICGELAGDPALTGLLLSLGLRRLSVSRTSYPGVVDAVRRLCLGDAMSWTDKLLSLTTGAAVRKFIAEHYRLPF